MKALITTVSMGKRMERLKNIIMIAFDELGDVIDSMIETGGMTKEEYDITLHRATRRYK